MQHTLYHIDAFASKVFKGNSACVVVLGEALESEIMLKIAMENAVAETAFILPKDGGLSLRWFTPDLEMDLCGHATIASAFVIFNYMPQYVIDGKVRFETCEGVIEAVVETDENDVPFFAINFPVRKGVPAELPQIIKSSLSIQPKEVYLSRDYLLVYNSASDVVNMVIDKSEFDKINLGPGGVIITAQAPKRGESLYNIIGECDFVSRFFTPQSTILEDPVTGSSHCTLVPYWCEKLGKNDFFAKQLSSRGGELFCTINNNRVIIKGKAICYLKGEISI